MSNELPTRITKFDRRVFSSKYKQVIKIRWLFKMKVTNQSNIIIMELSKLQRTGD